MSLILFLLTNEVQRLCLSMESWSFEEHNTAVSEVGDLKPRKTHQVRVLFNFCFVLININNFTKICMVKHTLLLFLSMEFCGFEESIFKS